MSHIPVQAYTCTNSCPYRTIDPRSTSYDKVYAALHLPLPLSLSINNRIASSRLIPHRLQMLDDQEIRVQESIHTALRAALLSPIQLPTADRARDAFLPADVREVVNRCIRIN